MRRSALSILASLCLVALWSSSALASSKLVEPTLKMRPVASGVTRVAITLDACMGRTDFRILDTLVSERIPATVFVTARWIRRNRDALAIMLANPDLFEIENHGQDHIPAIDRQVSVYGIAAAGSLESVMREVNGGREAIIAATGKEPRWFRGATAKYTNSAMVGINDIGERIAGYSINGDGGSLLGAGIAQKRIAAARDGDVVIAHINQPTHEAGEGVAKGLLALKTRGVTFVRLDDPGFDPETN
ncbi:polysaccharide deacetylase family protein [Agrobacterium sp.]|jgi:peptidoglycan/xylan/chitin deacetylase (PgdA/CDA1 family)|uniref:polysaccharide deacetylase family protein n=1 Tax=Agrobacterium sp. TaxID=361 RepID=UPI0028ADDE5E|nr:polysaccharide deacetylase family protein [Agrobacterium sp.]